MNYLKIFVKIPVPSHLNSPQPEISLRDIPIKAKTQPFLKQFSRSL